jgi:transcriptional regulator with XRE-family HTH domain
MKTQTPRQRHLDILDNMPRGKQKVIAGILGCSKGYVSSVLNGLANQDSPKAINIIRMAERYVSNRK